MRGNERFCGLIHSAVTDISHYWKTSYIRTRVRRMTLRTLSFPKSLFRHPDAERSQASQVAGTRHQCLTAEKHAVPGRHYRILALHWPVLTSEVAVFGLAWRWLIGSRGTLARVS